MKNNFIYVFKKKNVSEFGPAKKVLQALTAQHCFIIIIIIDKCVGAIVKTFI